MTFFVSGVSEYLRSALKPFGEALEASNRFKTECAPVAIIIQGADDDYAVLSSGPFHWNVLEIAKTHRVVMKIIDQCAEINSTIVEWGAQADVLVLNVHGHETGQCLGFGKGAEGKYTVSHVSSSDFSHLSPQASIVIHACYAGKSIAGEIQKYANRSVVASTEDTSSFKQYINKDAGTWTISPFIGNDPLLQMVGYVKKNARAGCGLNQRSLALLYRMQIILPLVQEEGPTDRKRAAIKWYTQAAQSGLPVAHWELGLMLKMQSQEVRSQEEKEIFLRGAEICFLRAMRLGFTQLEGN